MAFLVGALVACARTPEGSLPARSQGRVDGSRDDRLRLPSSAPVVCAPPRTTAPPLPPPPAAFVEAAWMAAEEAIAAGGDYAGKRRSSHRRRRRGRRERTSHLRFAVALYRATRFAYSGDFERAAHGARLRDPRAREAPEWPDEFRGGARRDDDDPRGGGRPTRPRLAEDDQATFAAARGTWALRRPPIRCAWRTLKDRWHRGLSDPNARGDSRGIRSVRRSSATPEASLDDYRARAPPARHQRGVDRRSSRHTSRRSTGNATPRCRPRGSVDPGKGSTTSRTSISSWSGSRLGAILLRRRG